MGVFDVKPAIIINSDADHADARRVVPDFCPACGHEIIDPADPYCPFCGEELGEILRPARKSWFEEYGGGVIFLVCLIAAVVMVARALK